MEGRRVTASRPCSGRRVLAKKALGGKDGVVNTVKKLQMREISSKRDRSFRMNDAKEAFMNIGLQEEYDLYDIRGESTMELPLLQRRSKIVEIVAAYDLVVALDESGLCTAFNRVAGTSERICFLNGQPYEAIRSLFYNKNNDSIITVSVYAAENYSILRCKTTRIEYIKTGRPDEGFPIFELETLKWPGFVEFDDVNGKILTFSAEDNIYRVYDLKNYTLLYSITDKNIEEIKISPGVLFLIYCQASGHVPLKILSIETGTVLKTFKHRVHQNKAIDFIEQFNEKLLIKQEDHDLEILDVRTSELKVVSKRHFVTPTAFIFLNENQLFLTFINSSVAIWNFRGELVTSFEDHILKRPDCNTSNIYISNDQHLVISFCKSGPLSQGNSGSINVSNVLTGKSIAKINANNVLPPIDCMCNADCGGKICNSRRSTKARTRSTVAEALENITAIFYDEDRKEIYTGNHKGLVHVWSN